LARDFWRRAQEGEQGYWESDGVRASPEGDPERRKDFWNTYLELIQKHRPFNVGDRVLDLGCGPSGILTAMTDSCDRYGVDPLLAAYRTVYHLSPDIHYSRQMGEDLAFDDGFFQVAMCINVLDHTRDPNAVWSELHRVLEPGGYLLFEVDTFKGFKYHHKKFKRWSRMVRGKIEKHPHTFRIDDLTRVAQGAGFEVVEQKVRPYRKREELLLLLRKRDRGVRGGSGSSQ
jgi:SAM-dependent methyltransferase